MNNPLSQALGYFDGHREEYLEALKALVRIPSVSFPGFPKETLLQSAEAVVALLKKSGLSHVQTLTVPGAHPAVYGESLSDPSKPTVLLYSHHDVQPPGDKADWNTPPFEPTLINGCLFGRGAADDKAGISVSVNAVNAWLKTAQKCPINVKLIIEGEEEYGSEHLLDIIRQNKKLLQADCVVPLDVSNLEAGLPSLTTTLRGLIGFEVVLSSMKGALHSGMWGGLLPDPAIALSKMLGSLLDDQGRITIPGIYDSVRPLSPAEEHQFAALPYDEKKMRRETALLEGTQLLQKNESPYKRIWRLPSLTVHLIEASRREDFRGIINEKATARLSIRLVPDMDPDHVEQLVHRHLQSLTPWGLQLKVTTASKAKWWETKTDHPYFQKAMRALSKGYGKPTVTMGCGGSIPFVETLSNEFGGIPALLLGIEDPETNAHGPNESLSIDDWEKATRSLICLFDELGK